MYSSGRLTGSLVFNEEKFKSLFKRVLIHIKLHMDPAGKNKQTYAL